MATSTEVEEATLKLRVRTASGPDHFTAEHIQVSGKKLCPLVTLCFTGFFSMDGCLTLLCRYQL